MAPAINAAAIPQMLSGVLPKGNVNDIDRWDADDLDLRELLERMESNREEVTDFRPGQACSGFD